MKFPSIDKYLSMDDQLIMADENSRSAVFIPDIISDYGGGVLSALKTRLPIINMMVSCMMQAKISAKSITKNPKLGKTRIADEELVALEKYAKSLGVSSIGYTTVDRDMIFKDTGILYDNAIVFIIEMKKSAIGTAPSKTAIKEIFRTYNELGVIVNKVSDFIREKGFNAMASPALGGAVSYVPLAQKAGLGIIGKHGLLISDKDFGPSLRIAAVYTDIESLPLAEENMHMWVKDFCNDCNKCVRSCPAGAIYEKSFAVNGNSKTKQCIDNTKCATPFANDYGCTICVKNCAFFNGDYNKIKSKFLNR
ncbi:MAG: 4Fe-4S binding protein [Acetobacterium sp.]